MIALPVFVCETINTLEQHGFEAYAVGGAVRDLLLGKKPTDWDIATSALPRDVIKILGEKNCIPTGIKHGTITYIGKNIPLEITTYRIDGKYTDGRHPEGVTFSGNIYDDLSRRDFTVNAMAFNPVAGLIDPFNGQNDLSLRIIRTVGRPDQRFQEDGLRILRGLRFAAVLNFKISPGTSDAIHQHKALLCYISKERIQAELSKLVMAKTPELILTEFADVFQEILSPNNFCPNQWRENAKLICSCPQVLSLRLAVLLDNAVQHLPSHQLLRALKYDNKTIKAAKTISTCMDLEIAPEAVCIKRLLSMFGADTLKLILEAKRVKYNCDLSFQYNIINEILLTNQCYLQNDLALDGNDLSELGFNGAQIGKVLKYLLNEVIEEKCENKKPALIELAKQKGNTL